MHARVIFREPSPLTEGVRLIRARFSVAELLRLGQLGGRLTEIEAVRVARYVRALEKSVEREVAAGAAA